MAAKQDRLFNPNPNRHYRRHYNVVEVYVGAVLVCSLGIIAAWVIWRGQHPDPALYSEGPELVRRDGKTSTSQGSEVDRGVLPIKLAPEGWQERGLATFDATNLYLKINGREGFFKSFGFKSLTFVTLEFVADRSVAIDLEVYDLGTAASSLGCFAAESPSGAAVTLLADGLTRTDRNASYLTRGQHYIRALGGEESERITLALAALQQGLVNNVAGAPLPWSYSVFVATLKLKPGDVSYAPKNAFSFSFGRGVHIALLPDGETEAFVVPQASEAEARDLAQTFVNGFLEMGEESKGKSGLRWAKDEYLHRFSTAKAMGKFVVGIRSAISREDGNAWLTKVTQAIDAVPYREVEAPPQSKTEGKSEVE